MFAGAREATRPTYENHVPIPWVTAPRLWEVLPNTETVQRLCYSEVIRQAKNEGVAAKPLPARKASSARGHGNRDRLRPLHASDSRRKASRSTLVAASGIRDALRQHQVVEGGRNDVDGESKNAIPKR